MPVFSQDTFARALRFAAEAHGDQRTPHALPYVVHVTGVAMEVVAGLRAEPGRDEDLAVVCALLHDVVEDTEVPLSAVEAAFGAPAARGVLALTKNEGLPKGEKMADSLDRILQEPGEVAIVKLGDRITNLATPPSHWSQAKIEAYRAEAQVILDRLGGVSAFMAGRLADRIARYPTTL